MDYGEALESDLIAQDWLKSKNRRFGHFINGKFTKPKKTFKTINPANGDVLANISKADTRDVVLALKAPQSFQNLLF